MGNKLGKKESPKESHFLHFHRLDENRLWVFYPRSEMYDCFPVFADDQPFFFGNLETIGVPKANRIYIIGGHWFKQNPTYRTSGDEGQLSKFQKKAKAEGETQETPQEIEDEIATEHLYARAEQAAEHMAPTDLVGYIELTRPSIKEEAHKLMFTSASLERLPKPRTNHSMIFLHPFIYVIGGIVDNLPTQSGLKYDIEMNVWSDIATVGFSGNLSSPAIVGYGRHIFLFDCYSEYQCVHKYQTDYDVWENIPFNTPDFKIPRSLNALAFR